MFTHPDAAGQPAGESDISGYAMASIMIGLLWIFGLGSVASVTCGHRAVLTIKQSRGRIYGIFGARVGLAIGYIGLAFGGIFWFFLVAGGY